MNIFDEEYQSKIDKKEIYLLNSYLISKGLKPYFILYDYFLLENEEVSIINFEGEKIGIYCYKHKLENMIDIISKTCQFTDCKIRPQFNFKGEKIGIFCKEHALDNMIDIKHKKCKFIECMTRPIYNFKGEKIAIYCKEHKLNEMINIYDKTCIFDNCSKIPTFNYEGKKNAIYCKDHKLNEMINVRDKTCIFDNCSKIPTFNFEGKKFALYCKEHKLENMLNVCDRKCQFINCKVQPTFNYRGEKIALYCKKHALHEMVDVKNKICLFDNCETIPNYNFEGEKIAIYCKKHALDKMIDVKNKTCKNSWCTTHPKQKYKDYCLRCFIHEFPDQEIARHYKIKETHVTDYLKETFPDKFTFDKTVGGCSKRRPDAYLDLLTHIIIVEIDENQHKNYDTTCEIARINELFNDLGDRSIVFIRFNPDSYDNKLSSFKYHKTSGVPIIRHLDEWNGRLESLKNCIDKYIHNIPSETKFEYLFYDKN